MAKRKSDIKYFVNAIINQEDVDDRIQELVQVISNSYGESFKCMVQTLKINEQIISSGLEILAKDILLGEARLSHMLVLIVFLYGSG